VWPCDRQMERTNENIAMPLRMIEIYTDPATYINGSKDVVRATVQHLVRNGRCFRFHTVTSFIVH